jgi:putative PIN family toxin of toxin-antitoxin system
LKRLVVDPNVLASGIPWQEHVHPPGLLVDGIEDEIFEAVACPQLLGEVRKTLRKPYFRKRIDKSTGEDALGMLEAASMMREDPKAVEEVLKDPKDDYLLALARESGAEAIVSGDKHLLNHPGLEPRSINAREACELLGLI